MEYISRVLHRRAPWPGETWVRFFARIMLGLLFLMAGWFKCVEMTPMGHAERFFTGPYADSWIPYWLLLITGIAVPILELVAGALLVLGWRSREALIVVGSILLLVTYGHLLKEPLFVISEHIFPRTVLLVFCLICPPEVDHLSLDGWLARRRSPNAEPPSKG